MPKERQENIDQIKKIREQSLEYEMRSGLEAWRLVFLGLLGVICSLQLYKFLEFPVVGISFALAFLGALKLPEFGALITKKTVLNSILFFMNILIPLVIFALEISMRSHLGFTPKYFLLGVVSWCFFPWRKAQLNILSAALFIMVSVFSLWLLPSPYALSTLGLTIIGIVYARIFHDFNEYHRSMEIDERMQLYEELNSREITIAEKSVEGLRLEDLSRQFSPQVVHAIKEGRLCLREGIHRGEICAIFIDIVNSTDRLIRLDKDNVNQVITMFMEDTIKVLLKYDITIDKFLGDGVLAFSNDPVEHDDYVERVLRAAFEIRARINNRQEEYLDIWHNNLNIRIGIAAGFANVGFYGSNEYFKSYTAIGRVVNLASRICAFAGVNQILLSQEAAKKIENSDYNVTSLGRHRLRGFSDDLLAIYTVEEGISQNNIKELSIISQCPKGHGILALDRDQKGIYHLTCRVCGYFEDHQETNSDGAESLTVA